MVTQVKSSNIAVGAITTDQIASGAITVADIPDGEITAAKLHTTLDLSSKTITYPTNSVTADALHTTAVTDKLGYTPIAPNDSPTFSGLTVDTDTLYIDATNNRVGIGTSSPATKLVVNGDFTAAGNLIVNGSQIELPTGTSDLTSPVVGSAYFNTTDNALKIYGSNNGWGSVIFSPLGSQENPAESGYQLYQDDSTLPTGYYWIQTSQMSTPVQMWVDMQYGGYDFYAFQGDGISVNYANSTHSGTAMGLDICYPRSPNWWRAASNFVRNATGNSPLSGNYGDYFQIVYGVHKTSGGGNYTSTIFRHPDYGSGSPDHRVNDDGRWWVRDVTHSEPNGDYDAYAWFGLQAGGYTFPNPYTGQDIFFNDGAASYATGGYYLVSTNAKPD